MPYAPNITGVPELVESEQTGFLYEPGSLQSFVNAVGWIYANHAFLADVRRAAAVKVAYSFNRQRNLRAFADEFLARISHSDGDHAYSLLQQVQLSV